MEVVGLRAISKQKIGQLEPRQHLWREKDFNKYV